MDREIVVHIYNGILVSYKKEHTRVSPNEVDEPRSYYTEWSKSEGERQILCINTCIWNLERWYWKPIYRAAMEQQTERGDMWTQKRKERVGWIERTAWKHIHYRMENRYRVGISCVTQGDQPSALWQPRWVGEGREAPEGADICTPVADSRWCMAETNTIL